MKNKTLQEQIDKFYKETGYELEIKDGKPYYGGWLDLSYTKISKLPDNLVVGGFLNLTGTNITELPEGLVVGGFLDLFDTKITKLPDNLVVGGYLNLNGTKITKLPDNLVVGDFLSMTNTDITELPDNLVVGGLYLTKSKVRKLPENLVVGGGFDLFDTKITELPKNLVVGGGFGLYDTKITKLPENLVVGGSLDIRRTNITELPENLVVGGWFDIRYTNITNLPENLVVGGYLDFDDTKITKLPKNLIVGGYIYGMSDRVRVFDLNEDVRKKAQKVKFLQWNVGGKTYIKIDGIFSVVDSHKGNVWRTHRIGKEETLYIVTDGEGHYAHGNTLKEAKKDLLYKINDRDTSLYENLSADDEISFEEAIIMYRTITGACSAGTRDFVENRLPKPHKEKYTIREIIDLTDCEYGNGRLKDFFKINNR